MGGGVNWLIGFTPGGDSYVFALHNLPYTTLEEEGLPINFQFAVTGPTFSPDGRTFFNVQYPGTTFAVSGPFKEASTARQARMAAASAPAALGPHASAGLRVAARRHKLTIGQAMAFHRLGVLSKGSDTFSGPCFALGCEMADSRSGGYMGS